MNEWRMSERKINDWWMSGKSFVFWFFTHCWKMSASSIQSHEFATCIATFPTSRGSNYVKMAHGKRGRDEYEEKDVLARVIAEHNSLGLTKTYSAYSRVLKFISQITSSCNACDDIFLNVLWHRSWKKKLAHQPPFPFWSKIDAELDNVVKASCCSGDYW